jgi:glycosyltransferase involved in cell wall biosynthesis
MNPPVDVSIVLPCYNASAYVLDSVRQIDDVMQATTYPYELIFVDDHSQDDTASILKTITHNQPNRSLCIHPINYGKGKTLSDGFAIARGEIVGYIDLDLNNPAHYIFPMIQRIADKDADVCTALRVYKAKLSPYWLVRFIASKTYGLLARLLLQVDLNDVETGCKFFKRASIHPIVAEMTTHGWFWDTEIMVRAYYAGLSIHEIPTLYHRDTGTSTVRLFRDTIYYLSSLLRFLPIKRQLRKRWARRQAESEHS